MTDKADLYKELIPDVQSAVVGGESAAEAIIRIAWIEDLDPAVLNAWLLRSFKDHEALETWASTRRAAIAASSARFSDLERIISEMPASAIQAKVIPQFTPWHKWIRKNCWSDETAKREALDFASIVLHRRRLQLNCTEFESSHAEN